MLKYLKTTLIVAICIGNTFLANAQKVIEQGTITYSVEYKLPPDQASYAEMLPKEFKVWFKGNYSKFKMDMGMFSTAVILNNATNETLTLTDVPMQNKKFATKMDKEQAKKIRKKHSGNEDYDVVTTNETKKISGYSCTKYLLKDKESGATNTVWATTEIKVPVNSLTQTISEIKGVPLEFSSNEQGMEFKLTLKSIVEEPVEDINFDIPADYELMDFNNLLNQMGG